MFKKHPYFMKNKDWFYKIKLAGHKDVYELTELGKSIPEVFNSYLEFYNKKMEDFFPNGGTDVHSEFVLSSTKKIRKDLKEKGYADKEIEEFIYEFIHIEEIMSDKDKEEAKKEFSELDKEFNKWHAKKLVREEENKELRTNQNRYSNSIINRIKNKRKS